MQIHTHRSPYDVRGLTTWEKRLLRLVWIKSAFAVLASLKLAVQAAQNRRRAVAQLASMDDRMLQDMGLAQSRLRARWAVDVRCQSWSTCPRLSGIRNDRCKPVS
jgi:uncharacterized protein YjiS (DUF1127 family)